MTPCEIIRFLVPFFLYTTSLVLGAIIFSRPIYVGMPRLARWRQGTELSPFLPKPAERTNDNARSLAVSR
jgi:hypothetical protein